MRHLVGLGDHGRAGLLQDLGATHVRGFVREVGIHDPAVGGRLVLDARLQVRDDGIEAAFHGAEGGAGVVDVVERVVDRVDHALDRPLRRRGPVAKHHLQQHHGAVGLRRHWPVLRFSDLCDNDAVRDGDSFDHCYADPVNHAVVNIDTFGDGYAKSVAEFNKQSERES